MNKGKEHVLVNDEELARVKSRMGKTWRPQEPVQFLNTQATRDTIRHYCEGIGDVNPLYRDQKYAEKTKWGRIIAPPCFLYSVYWPAAQGITMRGVHSWHSGNEWEWYRPIFEGDEISFEVTPTDIVERPSKMAGRVWQAYDETIYKNQRNEVIAKVVGWTTLAERELAGEKGKERHKDIAKARYTPEEVERINQDYEKEVVRGGTPRYWEDVKVGEELTPVVKGILSLRDIVCFMMGCGTLYYKAHRYFYEYQKRHPYVGMIDRSTGVVDIPELVHLEGTRASEIGVPLAYDYGPQRVSWLGHLMTNWIGDDGFLKKLRVEIRRFNMLGDSTWCKGKVTKKFIENGEHLVECQIWAENQRGEITAPAQATVVLPSKG